MTDCPFCQRYKAGEYEDDFWPILRFEPLNPVTPGHMLFVPTHHVSHENTFLVGDAMTAAARWGREKGEEFNLITSHGAAATQTVEHLHIHYVPRCEGDGLALPWTEQNR